MRGTLFGHRFLGAAVLLVVASTLSCSTPAKNGALEDTGSDQSGGDAMLDGVALDIPGNDADLGSADIGADSLGEVLPQDLQDLFEANPGDTSDVADWGPDFMEPDGETWDAEGETGPDIEETMDLSDDGDGGLDVYDDLLDTLDQSDQAEVIQCADEPCTVVGAKSCSDQKNVVECGDFDADGCLEWGAPSTCPGNLICSGGFCAVSCVNTCAVKGSVKCDVNDVVSCDDHNSDGCLEWGNPTPCGEMSCVNGFCMELCQNQCTAIGAKECELNSVITCNDYNFDGCLEWGTPLACAQGLVCSGGKCTLACQDECFVALSKSCNALGLVVTCDDFNDDGCLEWGNPVACQQPYVCDQGNCALSCSDDCPIAGQKECIQGLEDSFHICDDWDEDGCLEWGSNQQCGGNQLCVGGNCATSCEDECFEETALRCLDQETAQLCSDHDQDGCLEWGADQYCQLWQACSQGLCQDQPAPAKLLVNELRYDDGGAGSELFVELKGPAGTPLVGYALVAVDGKTGQERVVALLEGVVAGDGFFVLARSDASSALLATADQLLDDLGPLSAPHSLFVGYGPQILDAVGYGTFDSPELFAGEGDAAAEVLPGQSLARDASGTDTNNNLADFLAVAEPTPGMPYVAPNQPPNAHLSCPASATVGVAAPFSAAASNDPDGTIVLYEIDFGDSNNYSGSSSTATNSYDAAGDVTVVLTVTDNKGATDSAQCVVTVVDGAGPLVTIVKPSADKQVTQGTVVQITVDAEATPGRSVAKVDLMADGVLLGGEDLQPPYNFSFTVPMLQPTDSEILIVAKATDSAGAVGLSDPVKLLVKNDLPVPSFTAVVSGALKVTVDAASTFDTETAAEQLLVRWDFQSDGTWDTDWSTEKVRETTYDADGTYTITMQVKDGAEQVASTARSVTLSSIQYVGGSVTTTTWTGTIVVTGDVTVGSGETLTIAPCTQVLFAWNDQTGDGTGDWGMLVSGKLLVEGTEECPVIFTSLGTAHRHPKAWDGVRLNGAGHSINWAIFEYADTALDLRSAGSLTNSVVRYSRLGIFAGTGSNFQLADCAVRGNTDIGARMEAGQMNLSRCTIEENGTDGILVSNGTLTLTDSTLQNNGASGLRFYGNGTGTVTRNLFTGNAWEGIRVETNGTNDPTPVINYNNIYGNAVVGARVVQSVNLSVTQSSTYGTVSSQVWSTPDGETIDWVAYNYTESDSGYYWGYLTSGSGTQLFALTSSSSGWRDVQAYDVSDFKCQVQSTSYSSYSGTMKATAVAYVKAGAQRELSVITKSHRLDARHNYFGVFPDVLDVVSVGNTDRANVEGFVGVPFDSTWSKGIYYGGETLSSETLWFGEIIVTGQLDVTNVALTVEAGTTVRFACVDSNNDGIGDCDIEVGNGQLITQGTSADPVIFTSWRETPAPMDWSKVLVYGSGGATLTHTRFEYGNMGLEVRSGTHWLDRVTMANNEQHGLLMKSASNVVITGLVSEYNGADGVRVDGSTGVSLDKSPGQVLTLRYNQGNGISFVSSNTGISLRNASITYNDAIGIWALHSKPAISYCNISYNDYGVFYEGSAAGTLNDSNVKFNDREGLFLLANSNEPNPVITGNNIYGNSVSSAGSFLTTSISATKSSDYGWAYSPVWSTPDGQVAEYMRVQYSESDSGYYWGYVYKDSSSGSQVFSYSTSIGHHFRDIRSYGATKLVAAVQSTSYSNYSGTTTVSKVFVHKDSSGGYVKELAAVTNSGTVNCTDNYWGLGLEQLSEIPSRFELGRPEAVDYSSYVGVEKSGTGPQ